MFICLKSDKRNIFPALLYIWTFEKVYEVYTWIPTLIYKGLGLGS